MAFLRSEIEWEQKKADNFNWKREKKTYFISACKLIFLFFVLQNTSHHSRFEFDTIGEWIARLREEKK